MGLNLLRGCFYVSESGLVLRRLSTARAAVRREDTISLGLDAFNCLVVATGLGLSGALNQQRLHGRGVGHGYRHLTQTLRVDAGRLTNGATISSSTRRHKVAIRPYRNLAIRPVGDVAIGALQPLRRDGCVAGLHRNSGKSQAALRRGLHRLHRARLPLLIHMADAALGEQVACAVEIGVQVIPADRAIGITADGADALDRLSTLRKITAGGDLPVGAFVGLGGSCGACG
ncbi:MAG: hypothetical protein EBU31_00360 [Proteobacteria bacterium]|nr:hypothetical protein [Pseudomonadota bacterium]